MTPAEDKAVPDHVRAALGAAALDIAQRTSASRSIARIVEPHALTTRTLEERRLIHRDESARVQADAFREIRTRLLALGGSNNFVTMEIGRAHV